MPVSITRIISPTDWRQRQIENLKAVGVRNYEKGIDIPKKDPIKAAIDADSLWQARLKEAMDKGRRKAKLSKVTADEWNTYAHAFASELEDGVVKREAKVARFVDAWHPKLSAHVSKIDALPAATDADMEKRMVENLRGLKALKGSW
jgi:hypothetical protein